MFAFDKPLTWIIILLIVLLIFGAGKLPDIGKSFGKSIKEFKSEVGAGMNEGAPTATQMESKPTETISAADPNVTVRRTIRKLEDGTEEIVEERVVRKNS
jgi:sec-independent protein translocase protein TatA